MEENQGVTVTVEYTGSGAGLDIVMQGWYPLGGRGYTAELLGDETIYMISN